MLVVSVDFRPGALFEKKNQLCTVATCPTHSPSSKRQDSFVLMCHMTRWPAIIFNPTHAISSTLNKCITLTKLEALVLHSVSCFPIFTRVVLLLQTTIVDPTQEELLTNGESLLRFNVTSQAHQILAWFSIHDDLQLKAMLDVEVVHSGWRNWY